MTRAIDKLMNRGDGSSPARQLGPGPGRPRGSRTTQRTRTAIPRPVLYKARQAASALGVGLDWFRYLVRSGIVQPTTVPGPHGSTMTRYTRESLEAAAKNMTDATVAAKGRGQ